MADDIMKKLVSMCKQRGVIFPGSEIYGGLANTWDYGPLGVELKNNVKKEWWKHFVQNREDMVGLDCAILMHPKVWEASGHIGSFTDPLVDCKNCRERFRADHIIENTLKITVAGKTLKEITEIIKGESIKCPNCGESNFTEAREFNLMFKTFQGVVEDKGTEIYLRPETAQGIFVNFKNVQRSSRKKIPFGIAQIGKAFRNEITPGNFIFRTREFEQMEIEYFVKPGDELNHFDEWVDHSMKWFLDLGLNKDKLQLREHPQNELSHYSNRTVDIEYNFPFGWGELEGIASRTNFDLKQHSKFSTDDLLYQDTDTNEKYTPYVIEPSFGVDRTLLTFLIDSFKEEKLDNGIRNLLSLDRRLAPIKIAILPLKKNEERIVRQAREIFDILKNHYHTQYDDTGSIGKLYRRQDEVGTPFCLTVDFETIEEDKKVTVRERDTMKQERISISGLLDYFRDQF
ncbi:MAG: glycine--tRNA ligase [Spirochaetota bacterium]|nr:glycine--tRNA ligase [Spirochaetota bacterium]